MQAQRRVLKVLLVRHGETQDNKTKTIAGQRPGKLTATGITQAEKIGAYLNKQQKQFDHIYVSDLGRTKQTFANAVLKYPYLKNVATTFTPLVRERSGGILQGKPLTAWEQGAKKEGKNIRAYKCQGSQSWQDVNIRASKFLDLLVNTHLFGSKKQQTKILVVTHGGFIMQFNNVMEKIGGKQQKFDNSARNCSMHEFEIAYPEEKPESYLESKTLVKYILKNFVGHLQ